MKKLYLALALTMSIIAAQAQVTVAGSKLTDNLSITLKGGGVSPLQHYAFWPATRGMFGVELRKQITPVLGVGVEGEWSINTSSWNKPTAFIGAPHSATIIDHQLVGGFATLNIANAIAGYTGTPRFVEVEGVVGLGWGHGYKTGKMTLLDGTETKIPDQNSWYTKAGLNVNMNLGESKAWTVSLKPAIVYNMGKRA